MVRAQPGRLEFVPKGRRMTLSFPDRIQTARLVLRAPTMDDGPAIFERWAQDADVVRYLTWGPDYAVDEVNEFLRQCQEMRRSGERMAWVLTLAGDGSPITRP